MKYKTNLLQLAMLCVAAVSYGSADKTDRKSENDGSLMQPPREMYQQKVEIAFSSNEMAAKAKASILPVYSGKKWAVTCRWDDTNPLFNSKLSALMKQHGIRGTFYQNGTDKWRKEGDNKIANGQSAPAAITEVEMVRSILNDGNAIGGHGLTHPMLGIMSKNRIFEELMRLRVQLEEISDSPVCAYAFSFVNYSNYFEQAASQRDIMESLLRSGFYTVGEPIHRKGMPGINYISTDGSVAEKVKENVDKLLLNTAAWEKDPCMAFSMHPGAHQNSVSEGACLDVVANNPEYWYCTQDEYAAYRMQFLATKIDASVAGNVLKIVLSRPVVKDLNNQIPITMAVSGVDAVSVKSIKADNSLIERSDADGQVRFNLHHDRVQQLPSKIDWIANGDNELALNPAKFASKDFPGLTGILWKEGQTLKWILKNNTEEELTHIQATCRLPVAYKDGARMKDVPSLAKGAQTTQTETLSLAYEDPKYLFGNAFFAVEINFTQKGKSGRLYLTSYVKDNVQLDKSFPNNQFVRIGPIPKDQYVPQMAEDIMAGKTNQVVLKDGKVLKFENIDISPLLPKNAPPQSKIPSPVNFEPEMVFVTGGCYLKKQYDGVWIYRSTILSEKQESAFFYPLYYTWWSHNKKTVYVNGSKLVSTSGMNPSFMLNAGKNDLVVVFQTYSEADALSSENAGFFCRIASAQSPAPAGAGESRPRMKTIEYVLPDVK